MSRPDVHLSALLHVEVHVEKNLSLFFKSKSR